MLTKVSDSFIFLEKVVEIPSSEKKLRILHVDDDECFLELAKIYLEELSDNKIEVTSISDPRQVFTIISQEQSDIIISDQQMPYMTGLELFMKLRKLGIDNSFIILTGQEENEILNQSIALMGIEYPQGQSLDTLGIENFSRSQILNFIGIEHFFQKNDGRTSVLFEELISTVLRIHKTAVCKTLDVKVRFDRKKLKF
ncbi:MAG: response regulator [Candidatus Odinarchaeota archaeon]